MASLLRSLLLVASLACGGAVLRGAHRKEAALDDVAAGLHRLGDDVIHVGKGVSKQVLEQRIRNEAKSLEAFATQLETDDAKPDGHKKGKKGDKEHKGHKKEGNKKDHQKDKDQKKEGHKETDSEKEKRVAKKAEKVKSSARAASKAVHKSFKGAHPRFHEVDMLPLRRFGKERCGEEIPAAKLGLKKSELVARFWKNRAFLQVAEDPVPEPEPSLAKPGSGANQVTADHIFEKPGTVNNVEPFIKVFKDGFSPVSCIEDTMYEFADKYGNNKFSYSAHTVNVSIVVYKEVVLDSFWKPMSPEVCYTFCRTVPDMVFFGITNGKDCYCTPYYDPVPGFAEDKSAKCDVVCEGDQTQICGGKKKSTVFEMHYCADTAQDLQDAASNADEVIVYFYDTAYFANSVAFALLETSLKVQEVAGKSGDTATSDQATQAKIAANELRDAIPASGCVDNYKELLAVYKETKEVHKTDFTMAVNLVKADNAIAKMKALTPATEACAKTLQAQTMLSFPLYWDFSEAASAAAYQTSVDSMVRTLEGYYPVSYALDRMDKPKMSTCKGKALLSAGAMTLAECSEACDQTRYPETCVGFQFTKVKGDEATPVPMCYLFSKLFSTTTYDCPILEQVADAIPKREEEEGLLDKTHALRRVNNSKVNDTGVSAVNETKPRKGKKSVKESKAEVNCMSVRRNVKFTGLTCAALFGEDSSIMESCPKECGVTDGASLSAVCYVKFSETGVPDVKVTAISDCYGGKDCDKVSQSGEKLQTVVPLGDDGPLFAGDVSTRDGDLIEEPFEYIWTRSTKKEL